MTSTPADQTSSSVAPNQQPSREESCCSNCASKDRGELPHIDQFVFAIGKLDVKFPNIGLEREFQRAAQRSGATTGARGERLAAVLRSHRHIASRICPLLLVGGIPVYVIAPTAAYVRDALIEALAVNDSGDQWVVVSGRLGPPCRPTDCGGVVAPVVACDELYSFTVQQWSKDLTEVLQPAIKAKRATDQALTRAAKEVFSIVVSSAENSGASEQHRALNYALVRHPGIFLTVAERSDRAALDKIETRMLPSFASRRQVAIVFTFVDNTTGVAERLFCRIDVTDEWPFVAGSSDGGPGPLGLAPFVENDIIGPVF